MIGHFMRPLHLLCLSTLLISAPAFAQTPDDRISQLEEEVMILQRKVDRNNSRIISEPPSSDGGGMANAQADARIAVLEEEMRNLRGQLEQKDFEIRKVADEFDKFKRDTEMRLSDAEKSAAAQAAAAQAAQQQPAAVAAPAKPGLKKKEMAVKEVPAAEEPQDEAPVEHETPATDEEKAGAQEDAAAATPREQYNYAFRLLNQNQYDEAAKNFADFTRKYPKDPLVGNAYYWRGETFYIRKDFNAAVENFQKGYEAMPKGPKAPDNLLKLGMSLAALKKKEEACVVLSQVITKYKASSANVAAKAQAEQKRAGC